MKKPGLLIIEKANHWLLVGLGRRSVSQACSRDQSDELAQIAYDFCTKNSLDSSLVMLAVATDSVLVAKIESKTVSQLKTNDALRYYLESCLPLDAESMVASLLLNSPSVASSETPLAIALEVKGFESLVDALESRKVQIQAIVPYALLVLQQACLDRIIPTPSITVWPEEPDGNLPKDADGSHSIFSRRVGVMRIDHDGVLTDWQMVVQENDSLFTLFGLWGCDAEKAIWIDYQNASPENPEMSSEVAGKRMAVIPTVLACKAASAILNRRAKPWVDLRRDRLAVADPIRKHRASLLRILYVALASVLSLGCLLGWLTYQYRAASEHFAQKQRDVFASLFPDQRIPAGIITRLRSELTKSKAIRSTDKSVDVSIRALPILHQALSSLPKNLTLELNEVRVENGRVVLELLMSDQKDVGAIASALAGAGFAVEPPATSLIDGTTIQTTVMAESKTVGSK